MKTLIKILISLTLIYTPFFAFAGAAEKWEILENVYDQSSNKVKIEARKITQEAANSGRYKVEVPVSASTLGKSVKMMMWTGVAVAGVQAMLEGIGWIIDTGSQTIKRPKDTTDPLQPPPGYFQFSATNYIGGTVTSDSLSGLVTALQTNMRTNWRPDTRIELVNIKWATPPQDVAPGSSTSITTLNYYLENNSKTTPWQSSSISAKNIVRWNPDQIEPDYEVMSDSQLGEEILGKGENTSPIPAAVTDAYNPNNPVSDAPAPKATQDALDNANPQPETEPSGETKPKPNLDTDGDGEPDAYDPAQPDQGTEFQLPNFCSWAPAVCDFFTVQKSDNKDIKNNPREQIEQDKTFFEKVAEWFDWSQTDDELPDNESPEIVEHITPDLKEDAISWGAACPADVSIPISMQGVSSTLVFSWSPWCQLLSIIKPAIIASAYIGAAFIVLGLRT